jgi:N-acetylneuraminic acid mutarotase
MRILIFSFVFLTLSGNLKAQIWQQFTDFPGVARDDGASFSIGSIHYLGTGRSLDFSCTGDFYAYDSYLEIWYPVASLPLWQERQYACAFSHEQYGYVVGGENCNGYYFNSFWKYDPNTNLWSEMPTLPAEGRAGCQQFMLGSAYYLIGGRNASGILDEVWCFDFTTNTWEQKGNLPFEGCWRGLAFSNASNGFLAAGRTNTANQTGWNTQTWSYEKLTDTWSATNILDFGSRMYVNTAQTDSLVFVYGGVDPNDNTLSSLEKINLNTLQKTNLSSFASTPRKGCMSFAGNGFFYLSTGIAGNNRLDETWRLAFSQDAGIFENNLLEAFTVLQDELILVRVNPILLGKQLKICDLHGRILLSQEVDEIEEKIAVNFLLKGTYFIEINGHTRKFLR